MRKLNFNSKVILTQEHSKFAKVGSKFCRHVLIKPSMRLNFCHSGEILPTLVTLSRQLAKPATDNRSILSHLF